MFIERWIKRVVSEELASHHLAMVARIETFETEQDETSRTINGELSRLRALTDEIEVRIERGNKIWRQVRAAEVRLEKLGEREDDAESEGQLPLGDEEFGGGEGVPPVREDLDPDPPYIQAAKEYARSILGR